MSNLNVCVVEGHLTADPKMQFVKDGIALCKFGVAANRTIGRGDNAKEEVAFIDITTWRGLAENCNRFLNKGGHVLVSGYLKQDRWEDNNGKKQSRIYIEGREVKFLPRTQQKNAA